MSDTPLIQRVGFKAAATRQRTGAVVLLLLTVSALSAATSTAAPITWSLTLDTPTQQGAAGTVLVYSGTVSNNAGLELLLSTGVVVFDRPSVGGVIWDFTDEFLNTLGIIEPTGYSGPLFLISLPANAQPGAVISGRLELTAFPPASPLTLDSTFRASVPTGSVPEPASGLLVALAVLITVSRWKFRVR